MKIKTNFLLVTGLLMLLAGCSDLLRAVEPKRAIDIEAQKVKLDVLQKKDIIAGELKQENITASGYDAVSYAIKYETIKANSAEKKADIIFFLEKDGIESAKRMVTIIGFKAQSADEQEPSPQQKINSEIEKVKLNVPKKAEISAGELTEKYISVQGHDTSIYAIVYKDIKSDNVKREAQITFYLVKETLNSKERTVTLTGFKAQSVDAQDTSPQEKINSEVDKITLNVPNKADISVSALTDNIIVAAEYNSAIYVIVYKNIKTDDEKREAQITFYLMQGTLISRERTVTLTGFKAQSADAQEPSPQQKINSEVDKIKLEVPKKAEMLAGEFKQEHIAVSGYDSSYAIKYEKVEGNTAERNAEISFFLKKDGITSKIRTIIITGFKAQSADAQDTSPQEKINSEVDKVAVDAKNKAEMTADQLKSEHLTFSAYDTAYTVHCKTIKRDADKKEAKVTFYLTKEALTSKDQTVTVIGFKAKPEESPTPQTIEIQERDLLNLFQLTETKITASAAAKKIAAAQNTPVDGFFFEETKAIAYDDEKGTFSVKVKGRKDGKVFDKTFNISGFTHPYAEQIWQIVKTNGKGKVKLDVGIENNLSIDKFIEQANAGDGANIKTFFIDSLTFSLHTTTNSPVNIALGETDEYILKAQFEKHDTKIKVAPEYIVKYNIKNPEETETVKQDKSYSAFIRVKDDLIQNYFNANDVFQYILDKTDSNFIKVDPSKFASSFYAQTKFLSGVPADLFDMTQITDYIEKYKTKEADEHLQLDIMAGIYNPKNGGIRANDTEGSLTVQYCIATTEQLEHQINDSYPGSPAIKAISKETTVTGFKKADENTLKDLFVFKILKQGTGTDEEAKKEWKKHNIGTSMAGTYSLFSGEDGVYSEILTFPTSMHAKPFKICINDSDIPSSVFKVDTPPHLSEGLNGVKILLNGVVLTKKYGDELLTVTFTLSNNDTVDVKYIPTFLH